MPSLALTWPDAASLVLAVVAGAFAVLASRFARGQAPGSAGALLAPIGSALGWIVALIALPFGASAFLGEPGGGVLHWGGPAGVYLNNRGLLLPNPAFGPGFEWVLAALAAAVALSILYALQARRKQAVTGAQSPVGLVSLALLVSLPLIAFVASGAPVALEYPVLRGFNFQGGLRVNPEFVALLLGLVLYTASFIAEEVRAGVQSVAKGQSEAAHALGLRASPTLRLVVLPQAMRVILPPLTSQYLNLTKNSSLAVFIGYPELVQVFMGTVLNQTGAAVQVIAVTMAVYLTISLATSGLMALYARRTAWAER
jgi:general L-amino acid transport system permease protein